MSKIQDICKKESERETYSGDLELRETEVKRGGGGNVDEVEQEEGGHGAVALFICIFTLLCSRLSQD